MFRLYAEDRLYSKLKVKITFLAVLCLCHGHFPNEDEEAQAA